MRRSATLLLLLAALLIVGSAVQVSAATTGAAATADQGHYQFYDGHWWYWMPDHHWVYWANNRWNDFRPRVTLAANATIQEAAPAATVSTVPCPVPDTYNTGYGGSNGSYDSWSASVRTWGGYYFGRPTY